MEKENDKKLVHYQNELKYNPNNNYALNNLGVIFEN